MSRRRDLSSGKKNFVLTLLGKGSITLLVLMNGPNFDPFTYTFLFLNDTCVEKIRPEKDEVQVRLNRDRSFAQRPACHLRQVGDLTPGPKGPLPKQSLQGLVHYLATEAPPTWTMPPGSSILITSTPDFQFVCRSPYQDDLVSNPTWHSRQSETLCAGRTCENRQKQSRGWKEMCGCYEMIYADVHVR